MGTSIHSGAVIDEAARLAGDGEIGNSDAIRLLQLPHTPEDLHRVLERFDAQLTPEARSKLTLAALVPLPEHVSNQRFEPIFDRYRITGKTYTTASGTTVPNEIQYYNGEMVQVCGDCLNPELVRDVLAGSGYQPMILNYRDGRADGNCPVLGAQPQRYFTPPVQRDVHRGGRGSGRRAAVSDFDPSS